MKIEEKGNLLVIDDTVCWKCGEPFEQHAKNMLNDKTAHHSIEKQFHPVKNVIIPIHKNCHDSMHKTSTVMNSVKSKINGLNNYINELNEMLKELK